MTTPVYRTTRRIEFADTDMAGIVHFANFFRFMEAAEVEYLRSRGISVFMVWDGQKVSFPRVAASCDFIKPARFEDVLDIAVKIERLGRKSITYGFEFSLRGQLIARGQITSACCRVDSQPLEAIEIPPSLRATIESAVPQGDVPSETQK